MALSEDQISRFSRQILLKEVGGKGQEKLLQRTVRVLGAGPGIEEAVAYLAAGGSPIDLQVELAFRSFLFGTRLNEATPATTDSVLELTPKGVSSAAPCQVVVGSGVAFRTEAACDACWELTVGRLKGGLPEEAVQLGALAALVAQRIVLGLAEPVGLIELNQGVPRSHFVGFCTSHDRAE